MRIRLLAVMVGAWLALAAPASAHGLRLEFRGQAIVPTGTTFQSTTIGGLSSITYDRARGVYYALSDDPGTFQPARFYTVAIDLRHGRLSDDDVSFRAVTTLLAPDRQPYPVNGIDPEGLVLTCDRRLMLTSEGFSDRLIAPFVRRYALDGTFLSDFEVPPPFPPTADKSAGVRPNLAFESAGVTPDCRHFFTGTENALYQDGPAATVGTRSPAG